MAAPTTSPKILAAVLRVVSSRGLEEVSMRTVAAEAGVSIGAVQHHFKTKSDLLAAAMQTVMADATAQITQVLGAADSARSALRDVLHLLSAVDENTSAATVWAAFAARACVDPAIRQIHTREWLLTEQFLQGLLQRAHPGLDDPADMAAGLLALADGIAVARAAEDARMPGERARRLVDAALAQLDRGVS